MNAPLLPAGPCRAAGFGFRHVIMVLGCFANIVSYTDRGVLSLAIVTMQGRLPWNFSDEAQGIALSAFFMGYACTQILGGMLSRAFGPKIVICLATAIWSLATLATPSAAVSSLGMLCAARVLLGLAEGVLLPCLHDLACAWVPPHERSTAASLITSGQFLGQMIAMAAAPLISVQWSWGFYAFGAFGLVWCLVFALLGASLPQEHRCVSSVELHYIACGASPARAARESDGMSLRSADSAAAEAEAAEAAASADYPGGLELTAAQVVSSSRHYSRQPQPQQAQQAQQPQQPQQQPQQPQHAARLPHWLDAARGLPWRAFLCNRAAGAIYCAHWTHNWAWYLLLSWLPRFLTQQGADLSSAGFLSMLPPLLAFALSNTGAAVANRLLLKRLRLPITRVRRAMGAVAHLGPCLSLLLLALIPNPGPYVSASLACAAIGLGAVAHSAFWANIMDISPRHCGIVLGISNTMATLPGILCNVSTGYMLEHGMGWTPVLALAAGLEAVGAVVYVSFARGEPQF